MTNAPVDARGIPLTEGALVAFATKDRDSVLQFGTIFKIKEKVVMRNDWDAKTRKYVGQTPVTEYKIQMAKTDAHGNPIFDTEWRPDEPNPESLTWGGNGFGKHVLTDKQSKSGYVEYVSNKFLVL